MIDKILLVACMLKNYDEVMFILNKFPDVAVKLLTSDNERFKLINKMFSNNLTETIAIPVEEDYKHELLVVAKNKLFPLWHYSNIAMWDNNDELCKIILLNNINNYRHFRAFLLDLVLCDNIKCLYDLFGYKDVYETHCDIIYELLSIHYCEDTILCDMISEQYFTTAEQHATHIKECIKGGRESEALKTLLRNDTEEIKKVIWKDNDTFFTLALDNYCNQFLKILIDELSHCFDFVMVKVIETHNWEMLHYINNKLKIDLDRWLDYALTHDYPIMTVHLVKLGANLANVQDLHSKLGRCSLDIVKFAEAILGELDYQKLLFVTLGENKEVARHCLQKDGYIEDQQYRLYKEFVDDLDVPFVVKHIAYITNIQQIDIQNGKVVITYNP